MEEEKLDLLQEFTKLKSLIAPLMSFIQELKDLKRDLHISSESSISSLSIITSHIRSEIIKDLNSLLSKSDEKFTILVQETNEKQKELLDKIFNCNRQDEHLEFMIKDTNDLIVKHGHFIEKLRKDLDIDHRDLNEKVGYSEFLKLDKSLKHYAPLAEVNTIKDRIEELAEKTQITQLEKLIKKNSEKILKCFTKAEAQGTFEENRKTMMEEFSETFVKRSQFIETHSEDTKKSNKNEEDIKTVTKRVESIYEGFKRKISELFDTLNSKPWDVEFKHVWQKMEELATNEKLLKFREEVNEKNLGVKRELLGLEERAKSFELIIGRIDEIMLDKAAKDDVFFLTKQLERYALSTAVNEVNADQHTKLSLMHTQLSQHASHIETLKSTFLSMHQKLEILKKENFEVSNISTNLANIYEMLDRKADKSDIFIIHDIMGKKEEVVKLSEIEGISRKQVLLAVGILQSFCRTFLNAGENASVIKQQRLDVYKSLDGLQKWIKEGNGEPTGFLSIGRSNVNLKTDIFEEVPHTGYLRFNRRVRLGSVGTSPRHNKDELPSLNL